MTEPEPPGVPTVAWVTAEQIVAQAGAQGTPDEWATLCAAAVSQALNERLEGIAIADAALFPEIQWCALNAGVEAYKRREATFGITGYMDLQGAAIRVARDYLEAVGPIIARHATFGLA